MPLCLAASQNVKLVCTFASISKPTTHDPTWLFVVITDENFIILVRISQGPYVRKLMMPDIDDFL